MELKEEVNRVTKELNEREVTIAAVNAKVRKFISLLSADFCH